MGRRPGRTPGHPKRLLVEGATELRVIPELAERCGIAWPKPHPVDICEQDGVENLLKAGAIEAELKEPGLQALGIVLDADLAVESAWQRVQTRIRAAVPDLPDVLPAGGLVHVPASGPRVGVWVMPDNVVPGSLETFLGLLVPDRATAPLWGHAGSATDVARQHGAPYKDVQRDKAILHAWLAWQDEPGRQLHDAVKHAALRPEAPIARTFAAWLSSLFLLGPGPGRAPATT